MDTMIYKSVNPNAVEGVKSVLNYLKSIEGKYILSGQHTQTKTQQEIGYIRDLTGKEPALVGFELLAYSPNINYGDASQACLKEVEENKGTLETALEWAKKGALLTFTWHWFSPIGGRDKSFYAEHTDYDARKALDVTSLEHKAMMSDMDHMAGLLKPFCNAGIPILWRPFHEADGDWFWWGNKGVETAGELFKLMYHHFTEVHQLNNLIWVWNSPDDKGYPGDDVTDIVSADLYPQPFSVTTEADTYKRLMVYGSNKMAALGEIGTLLDTEKCIEDRIPWLWFMNWSYPFMSTEDHNKKEDIIEQYGKDTCITLDKLPKLY